MVIGSLVAINSGSWIVAWIGLEVNLLSILPIMAGEKTKRASESCIKYFLVQSLASLIILISSVFLFTSVMYVRSYVLFIGLRIKLGVAPFHFWFPVVIEGVGWVNCLLLITWQKLAPLFLIGFVKIIIFIIIITSLVGAFGGFGQTSVRKILAFSSINHVGWILAGVLWGIWVGLVYYWVYFVLSFLVVITLVSFKIFHIKDLRGVSYILKIMILIRFLSLGGLPPFMGFFPKWFVIEKLLWEFLVLSLVLIFSSLVRLYFYLRLGYPFLLLKYVGREAELGGTLYVVGIIAFFFLSRGGFFCYPLLSII